MNEKLKEILIAFVAKTTGKSEEEVSSLLIKKEADKEETVQENALSSLLELDKTRISSFDKKIKEQDDKGYKRGQAESLSKFEADVREKYGISDPKKGTELIDAIIAAKSTAVETDETKIKTSKVYLDTVDKLKKEKEDAVKEWQEKFEAREKQLSRETTFKTISDKALQYFESLKPILSPDKTKAENQKKLLLSQLNEFEFQIKEDGKVIVLKKVGDEFKVAEDEHGHPISFESIVKQKSDLLFDYQQGQQRQGSGNSNDGSGHGSSKSYNGPIPKTNEEYVDFISKAKDQTEKEQITEAWRAVKNSKPNP